MNSRDIMRCAELIPSMLIDSDKNRGKDKDPPAFRQWY